MDSLARTHLPLRCTELITKLSTTNAVKYTGGFATNERKAAKAARLWAACVRRRDTKTEAAAAAEAAAAWPRPLPSARSGDWKRLIAPGPQSAALEKPYGSIAGSTRQSKARFGHWRAYEREAHRDTGWLAIW